MISLPSSVKVLHNSATGNKNQATFEVSGLYPGYGVTIGNALRRVLLTSIEGVAVTDVKIKGVAHEFSTIPGVLEDVIMIILNLKTLNFKIHEGTSHKVELHVKGEKEIKGEDFTLFPQIELVNPELYIATITDKKTEFTMEITIEKGMGYESKEHRRLVKGNHVKSEIGMIAMDAIFTPIKNVNFRIESMRVGDRTDFDRLFLQIETDGTITPEEAFRESAQILIKQFTLIAEGDKDVMVEEKSAKKEGSKVKKVKKVETKVKKAKKPKAK